MEKVNFEYLIIGAGPAGLQMGYFLKKNGFDYCILEKTASAGSFFRYFPRYRKLISINKVYTGYEHPEQNLRWDWNSLLSDMPDLLVKNYSKEYFPKADDLVRYLEDFADQNELNIKYDTHVEDVSKNEEGLFRITCKGVVYSCKYLLVATGLSEMVEPEIEGVELCEYYSSCPVDPEDYANQKVLIIGKGNSGFEMADILVPTARSIHLLSPNMVSFAWETHYVGHLRAVNNNLLDTYLLKSQNAVLNGEALKIWKEPDGKLGVRIRYTKVKDAEVEDIFYDRVIVCCGFKMNSSFFNPDCKPAMTIKGKFPALTSEWESVNIPNLFFCGVLTHSRDYRQATSGFIHGFRYNCQALARMLLSRNQNQEIERSLVKDLSPEKLTELIIEKINLSSALWQQFGFFGDALVIDSTGLHGSYFDALPCDYIREVLCKEADLYFLITLEYGSGHRNPFGENVARINRFDVDHASDSDFLHPVIRKYSKGTLVAEKHLIEDLDGEFDRPEHREPLLRFMEEQLVPVSEKIEF